MQQVGAVWPSIHIRMYSASFPLISFHALPVPTCIESVNFSAPLVRHAAMIVVVCVLALVCLGQSQDGLLWHLASDPQALCNDFTRAGFFLRRNTSSDKWLIFLESGGFCFSNETCNRRFFRSEVCHRWAWLLHFLESNS